MNQSYFDEEKAIQSWMAVPDALKHMGYSDLRNGQKQCLHSIFGGKDTFCILPTGGGKTALAALPTLIFECQTIIFSPLIALMKDQVDGLNRKGIRTGAINSSQSDVENWNVLQAWIEGRCRILLVAPERISHPHFQQAIEKAPPGLVVIDEAHTMSKWSNSFRPSYVRCGDFVAQTTPKQVLALTATATKDIVQDVIRIMGTTNMAIECHYTERSNLKLSSEFMPNDRDLMPNILSWCRSVKGSVIVYCSTVKQVAAVTEYLSQAGESVTFYHAQCPDTVRDENQDKFKHDRCRIMVATNAFGMGIDKPDIECVIHASPPGNIEAIAQEIGRAARDGRDAYCHMIATPSGFAIQDYFWNLDCPSANTIQRVCSLLYNQRDSNDEIKLKLDEIAELIQDKGATAAMNYLVAIGCISRYEPTSKVSTFCVYDKDPSALKGTRRKIYDAIITQGMRDGHSGAMNPIYKLDLNILPDLVGVLPATIMSHIRQLDKDGYLAYTAPYSGKITKFIRRVTQEELLAAAERRETERHKMLAVREYIECPHDQKHALLNKYFTL